MPWPMKREEGDSNPVLGRALCCLLASEGHGRHAQAHNSRCRWAILGDPAAVVVVARILPASGPFGVGVVLLQTYPKWSPKPRFVATLAPDQPRLLGPIPLAGLCRYQKSLLSRQPPRWGSLFCWPAAAGWAGLQKRECVVCGSLTLTRGRGGFAPVLPWTPCCLLPASPSRCLTHFLSFRRSIWAGGRNPKFIHRLLAALLPAFSLLPAIISLPLLAQTGTVRLLECAVCCFVGARCSPHKPATVHE